jgi:hypothetical protein
VAVRNRIRQSPDPGLPREEGRRVLENVTLLLQAPDALSELAQLLALSAGQPVVALTAIALALATPVTQRLLRHPQALGDVRDRAALTDQLQRLPPELLPIGRPCLGHYSPSFQQRFRRKRSGLRKIGGIPALLQSTTSGCAGQDCCFATNGAVCRHPSRRPPRCRYGRQPAARRVARLRQAALSL